MSILRGLPTALVLVVALAGCQANEPDSSEAADLDVSQAESNATDAYLTAYITALNAAMPPNGDPSTVADLFSENAVQYHVFGEPPGGPQRTPGALRQFFGEFAARYSDWTHTERSRFTRDTWAVWEGFVEGHLKETGELVRSPIVFFLDFDDQGKVREARVYVAP